MKNIEEFFKELKKAVEEIKADIKKKLNEHPILKKIMVTLAADAASTAISTFIRKKIMEHVTPAVDPYSGRMVLFWKKNRVNPPPKQGTVNVAAAI